MRLMSIMVAAGLGFSTSAHALFADFTDSSMFGTGDFTEMIGGVTVTLSSSGALNFDEVTVGNGAETFCTGFGGMYACDQDGVGVTGGADNDEISNDGAGLVQSITVDFSEAVSIDLMAFLDLFALDSNVLTEEEAAEVDYDGGGVDDTFMANETFAEDSAGFQEEAPTSVVVTSSITFTAGVTNDGNGDADYALAGIEFSRVEEPEIPVPAALPLMLTAMVGIGFIGWRRRGES